MFLSVFTFCCGSVLFLCVDDVERSLLGFARRFRNLLKNWCEETLKPSVFGRTPTNPITAAGMAKRISGMVITSVTRAGERAPSYLGFVKKVRKTSRNM